MSYVQGFLQAVPTANREAYAAFARKAWAIFEDHGALSLRECWGVDVPGGEVTSFPLAVKAGAEETVVFSWMEWPDRASCDRAWEAVMADPRMQEMGEMPFDGSRMMWGGFEELVRAETRAPD